MTEIIRNVRGMRDLLDRESRKKLSIETEARQLALNYGYQEINTPIVEYSSVFNKSLGQFSDIVTKEMYNFKDEKGRSLTLRPEATASIARAIVSNGLLGSEEYRIPLKFFLFGPMFRYERPQKGRYRQFYQINFESFGKPSPECDVELISLAFNFLKKVKSDTYLKINSLGDAKSRTRYKNELINYLKKFKKDLSSDSITRLDKNPLRILDSKEKGDLEIVKKAPKMFDHLSIDSNEYYKEVKSLLKSLNIKFEEDSNLVRGLDYYKETVFEFKTDKLGQQQDTILGGGRYSGLVKMFGGNDLDGAGWAAGIDRLIDTSPLIQPLNPKISIVYDEKYKNQAFKLANKLRNYKKMNGNVEIVYEGSISKQIKKASKLGSKNIIIVENNEEIKISGKGKKEKQNILITDINQIVKKLNAD